MTLLQKRLMIVVIGFGLPILAGLWSALYLGVHIFYNLTNSLPYTVFIGFKKKPLIIGTHSYIVFNHLRYPNQFLIKKVSGIPGDRIERQVGEIWVGDEEFPLQTQTSEGKPLTPIQATRIPEESFFVSGTNFKSFDSRYEEFGLIHHSQIQGRVWPLF